MRRAFLVLLAVVVTAAAAACRSGSSDASQPEPAAAPSTETTSGSAPAQSAASPSNGRVRDCKEHVSGDLGDAWRSQTILVGPVGFVARSYRDAPKSQFAAVGRGRYRAQKVLLLVRRGMSVTLTILPHARAPRASLLYDPSTWRPLNGYRVREGVRSMTFHACDGEFGVIPNDYTQFNGAIIVAGPGCVPVDFRVAGRSLHYRANLSFGAGACA